jgi:hypothetical protein
MVSVVVNCGGTSGFDASSGHLLWHNSNDYGSGYVADGVVEQSPTSIDCSGIEGVDADTGRQLWQLCNQNDCYNWPAGVTSTVVGDLEYQFATDWSCYDVHNVVTGKMIADVNFPGSWSTPTSDNVIATPGNVLASTGNRLDFFKLTNVSHPIWSVAASNALPEAISTGHVLVSGRLGCVMLDSSTGAITQTFPKNWIFPCGSGSGVFVANGLAEAPWSPGGSYVLEMDPPAS